MDINGRAGLLSISNQYMELERANTKGDSVRTWRGVETEFITGSIGRHTAHTKINRNAIIVAIIMVVVVMATGIIGSMTSHRRSSEGKVRTPPKSRVIKDSDLLSSGNIVSRDFDRKRLSEKDGQSVDGKWTLGEDSDQIAANLKHQAESQDEAIGIRGKMKAFLNDHRNLDKSKYTDSSWSEWSSKVNAANGLIHDDSIDQSALNATMSDLSSAYDGLEKVQSSSMSSSSSPMIAVASSGAAQSYAHSKVLSMGWTESDFSALVWLWNRESGWNPSSYNAASGASGIPQCLGHSECQTDAYRSEYKVQVDWGLNYIASRYGNPSSAALHSKSTGWY